MKPSGIQRQRAPVTKEGLKKIEDGTLEPFDPVMYPNFNTGALETYFEEKNRTASFRTPSFRWLRLLLLIVLVGIPFTFVTQYVALKIGIVVSSLFYVSYIICVALKWKPNEVNIISSAVNLVDQTITGFVYVLPAVYFLASWKIYGLSENDTASLSRWTDGYALAGIVIITSMMMSLLALFFYIIFRRLWVVEDPLPTPGFESIVKLMELSKQVSEGSKSKARSSLRSILYAGIPMTIFGFFRAFPLFIDDTLYSKMAANIGMGKWLYGEGIGTATVPGAKTNVHISLSGFAYSIGWYMRSRTAFFLLLGTSFMWLVVVPLLIFTHSPYYWPPTKETMDVSTLDLFFQPAIEHKLEGTEYMGIPSLAINGAFSLGKSIGLGCLLGAGSTAILKTFPSLKGTLRDLFGRKKDSRSGWVPRRGWYEWPSSHIVPMVLITIVAIFLSFWLLGGFHLVASAVIAVFLVVVGFFLLAISVKIAGEAGFGPTLGMLSIIILLFFTILKFLDGIFDLGSDIIIITLIGATAFGASFAIPITVHWDYKTAHYIATRPVNMFKAQSVALLIGIPASVFLSLWLSRQIVEGKIDMVAAPQANAFASLIGLLQGSGMALSYMLLGLIIGIFVELLTGLGTVFGLGMFMPVGYPPMIMIGALSREAWERWLKKKHGNRKDWEEYRTVKLMDSYMVMTGLFIGEALVGFLASIYLIIYA